MINLVSVRIGGKNTNVYAGEHMNHVLIKGLGIGHILKWSIELFCLSFEFIKLSFGKWGSVILKYCRRNFVSFHLESPSGAWGKKACEMF